jgi:hypothetical protein
MRLTGLIFVNVLCVFCLMSCSSSGDPSAKTPQEFVQKYSKAYKDGKVDLLVKMTQLADDKAKQDFKDDTNKDITSKGFGYVAWTNTRYVSEKGLDKHIQVDVDVKGARSSIILVKSAEGLKLALNPSDYE